MQKNLYKIWGILVVYDSCLHLMSIGCIFFVAFRSCYLLWLICKYVKVMYSLWSWPQWFFHGTNIFGHCMIFLSKKNCNRIFCRGRTLFVCTVFLSDMPFGKCGMDGRMDGRMDGHTSIYSKLPSTQHVWGMKYAISMRNLLQKQDTKWKQQCFHFTSYIGVILSGTEDSWGMWSDIHVGCTALIPVWGRSMSSTAKDSWENYHVAGEHMHVADLNVTDLPSNSKSMKRAECRRLWCRIHTYICKEWA
jgi:hypothetical protein